MPLEETPETVAEILEHVLDGDDLPDSEGGSFLEAGSGTGVIAVTALDIDEKAAANAERHGVHDRVRVLHSNMYEALGPEERFDVIFWNMPWTYVDDGRLLLGTAGLRAEPLRRVRRIEEVRVMEYHLLELHAK